MGNFQHTQHEPEAEAMAAVAASHKISLGGWASHDAWFRKARSYCEYIKLSLVCREVERGRLAMGESTVDIHFSSKVLLSRQG